MALNGTYVRCNARHLICMRGGRNAMYTKNNRSGEDYLEAILILSDSEENAKIEIARFFKPDELF